MAPDTLQEAASKTSVLLEEHDAAFRAYTRQAQRTIQQLMAEAGMTCYGAIYISGLNYGIWEVQVTEPKERAANYGIHLKPEGVVLVSRRGSGNGGWTTLDPQNPAATFGKLWEAELATAP